MAAAVQRSNKSAPRGPKGWIAYPKDPKRISGQKDLEKEIEKKKELYIVTIVHVSSNFTTVFTDVHSSSSKRTGVTVRLDDVGTFDGVFGKHQAPKVLTEAILSILCTVRTCVICYISIC